ncbi:MAG: PAS domain S-box protein [Chloroflexi bacterium]|nr:PAS domain S-box protein [Chloroflexota bacterium]
MEDMLRELLTLTIGGERMTLRKKTLLIISTTFLGVIIILFFISQEILLDSYMDMPEDIYNRVQDTVAYLVLSIVGVSLVFAVVTILLLEKGILSQVYRLIKNVSSIGRSGDISTRVSIPGTYELAILASTINGMLAVLEESEGELRESEKRFKELTDLLPQIVFETDERGNLIFVNQQTFQATGYTPDDFNQGLNARQLVIPEDRDKVRKNIQTTLSGDKVDGQEQTALRKDGSTYPVIVYVTPIMREGKTVGTRGLVVDITERKRAEEKLQELYNEERELRQNLETEINKRIDFTRALVHELKTPITPVLAASELLLEELKDKPLLSLVQSIDRSASNLNRRIDELLDLARGELDMLRIEPESVDPIQLLQEIGDEERPVALGNSQSLILELPPALPAIRADRERLRQVIANLLNNAFKFTPAGGTITLRAREDGLNLIVEVQDTGRGISKKEQQGLFEAYYRAESGREHLSGLGLGLALAKRLVELQEGQIWVKSRKGEGSTFGFSIPLAVTSREKRGIKPGEES